ncbi:hypothetical protein O0L34_g1403 [Tuta absoluta]|nr:hypothetical protein O0L34_g1403 [Tuta absoluta]
MVRVRPYATRQASCACGVRSGAAAACSTLLTTARARYPTLTACGAELSASTYIHGDGASVCLRDETGLLRLRREVGRGGGLQHAVDDGARQVPHAHRLRG